MEITLVEGDVTAQRAAAPASVTEARLVLFGTDTHTIAARVLRAS
ncbi:hypothetical protein ACIG87_16955 [Micromonospora sp. NPDC051925]